MSSLGSGSPGVQTHPSDLASPPRGQHKVFSKLKVFSEPAPLPLRHRAPTQGAAAGLCVASAPRHAAGQVEVLPRECQELFLGKPWPLPSGMGGKEPLT